jgi:hypothetical protein
VIVNCWLPSGGKDVIPARDDRPMTTVRTEQELEFISHHIDAAHKAAECASAFLLEADSPMHANVTAEQHLAAGHFKAALAATAAQVVDAHVRLLELRLKIGAAAL